MAAKLCGLAPMLFGCKSLKIVQGNKTSAASKTSKNQKKKMKGTMKNSSSQPACNFIQMMELRKKIITFRDIFDLPPCSTSVSTDQLLIGTMRDFHKFYPESIPRFRSSELKGSSLDKVLIYFCKALQNLGDASKRRDEWIDKDKFDIFENDKCKKVDKLVEIAVATLNGLIKIARERFDMMDEDDQENKDFSSKANTFGKVLKDSYSDNSSSSCPSPETPTSVLPELTAKDSPKSTAFSSSSLLLSLRVRSVGRLNPIDSKGLTLYALSNVGSEKKGMIKEHKEEITEGNDANNVAPPPSAVEPPPVLWKDIEVAEEELPSPPPPTEEVLSTDMETQKRVLPPPPAPPSEEVLLSPPPITDMDTDIKSLPPPQPPPLPPPLPPFPAQQTKLVATEPQLHSPPDIGIPLPPPPPPPPAPLKSNVGETVAPLPPPPPPAPLQPSKEVETGAPLPLPPPPPLPPGSSSGIPPPPPPMMLQNISGPLPPPPPPMAPANGAAPPPPPPMALANGAAPPPPPPGAAKSLLRPKKGNSKLKRSSNMGNLYRVLKGKVEGRPVRGKSSNGKKTAGGGSGGGGGNGKQGMADALAEITKRSAYFQQIEEDVEKYAKSIKEIKTAVSTFKTNDMTELLKFHKHVESILENLTDESQVLARFEGFPSKKLEALRTASALYSKLDSMMNELKNWKIEPPLLQLLDKVERYFNKIKGDIDALERIKDEECKKLKSHNIDFDFQILVRIKEAMVDVSSNCMELALKERREAKLAAENEGSKTKAETKQKKGCAKMLWRAFQLAFRVYTFAGGHDDRADKLTRELAHEIETDPLVHQ